MFAALIWFLMLIVLGAVGYAGFRLGVHREKKRSPHGG